MYRPVRGLATPLIAVLLFAGVARAQEQPPPPPPPPTQQPGPPPYAPPPGYPPYQYPQYPPYYYPPQQYPYYWPPPPAPPTAARRSEEKKLPEDYAARTTPFVDALVTVGAFENRFSHAFDLGVQAGTFIEGRVRIAARLVWFLSQPEDDNVEFSGGEWIHSPSDSPNILWGGSLGIAMLQRTKFVLSPGLVFSRTDDTDYGSFVGVGVPFEWVMVGGMRFGFGIEVGRVFGGSMIERCQNLGMPQSCVPGEERRVDRAAGAGVLLDFHIGWGIFQPSS